MSTPTPLSGPVVGEHVWDVGPMVRGVVGGAVDTAVDGVVVRPMTADDLDSVFDIEARSTTEPWSRSLFADELRLSYGAGLWVVADEAGSVVGFAGLMMVADGAHVLNIAVDPGRRRGGLGAILLERILQVAVDRGATAATLEVRPDNRAALALYRRFGFRRTGKRRRYYADGTAAVIMCARRLPSIPSPDVTPGKAGAIR